MSHLILFLTRELTLANKPCTDSVTSPACVQIFLLVEPWVAKVVLGREQDPVTASNNAAAAAARVLQGCQGHATHISSTSATWTFSDHTSFHFATCQALDCHIPVIITVLMWASLSSFNTGFVSFFKRFSIMRSPRNANSDSTFSLRVQEKRNILRCTVVLMDDLFLFFRTSICVLLMK